MARYKPRRMGTLPGPAPTGGAARLAGAVAAVALVLAAVRLGWASDDAFITIRSVDHLVHGKGFSINVDQRVQSFTSPLTHPVLAPRRLENRPFPARVPARLPGLAAQRQERDPRPVRPRPVRSAPDRHPGPPLEHPPPRGNPRPEHDTGSVQPAVTGPGGASPAHPQIAHFWGPPANRTRAPRAVPPALIGRGSAPRPQARAKPVPLRELQ